MRRYTLTIPTVDNASPPRPAPYAEVARRALHLRGFWAWTEHDARGFWIDPATGQTYAEPVVVFTLDAEPLGGATWSALRAAADHLRVACDQHAIYITDAGPITTASIDVSSDCGPDHRRARTPLVEPLDH